MSPPSRLWRRRTAYVFGALVAAVFVMQGVTKFSADGFWTPAFERWGYPAWFRLLIGATETAGGIALLFPRLASYGAAALFTVMIGAFITRVRDGQLADVVSITIYMLLLAWFAFEWWERRWVTTRAGPER